MHHREYASDGLTGGLWQAAQQGSFSKIDVETVGYKIGFCDEGLGGITEQLQRLFVIDVVDQRVRAEADVCCLIFKASQQAKDEEVGQQKRAEKRSPLSKSGLATLLVHASTKSPIHPDHLKNRTPANL